MIITRLLSICSKNVALMGILVKYTVKLICCCAERIRYRHTNNFVNKQQKYLFPAFMKGIYIRKMLHTHVHSLLFVHQYSIILLECNILCTTDFFLLNTCIPPHGNKLTHCSILGEHKCIF